MNKYILIIAVLIIIMSRISAQTINISEMAIEQKIAQMIIARGDKFDQRFLDLNIGGLIIDKQENKEDYTSLIQKWQNNSKIKLLISADLEGYWNPFPFYKSKAFIKIKDEEEAYELGKEHAEILKELGYNLDFSPVVETRNNVWKGRSFTGSQKEIKAKIKGYIKGLQSEVLATAKHYPGGSLIKNPHYFKFKAEIFQEDLELFDYAIKQNVSAIMVGHPIVTGFLDSKGKQSSVSPEIIQPLREKFSGLIISDEVWMFGLRLSYLFNSKNLYIDLINAGNDIIIDAHPVFSYSRIEKRIKTTAEAVKTGKIKESRINESLTRILKAKGYRVTQ